MSESFLLPVVHVVDSDRKLGDVRIQYVELVAEVVEYVLVVLRTANELVDLERMLEYRVVKILGILVPVLFRNETVGFHLPELHIEVDPAEDNHDERQGRRVYCRYQRYEFFLHVTSLGTGSVVYGVNLALDDERADCGLRTRGTALDTDLLDVGRTVHPEIERERIRVCCTERSVDVPALGTVLGHVVSGVVARYDGESTGTGSRERDETEDLVVAVVVHGTGSIAHVRIGSAPAVLNRIPHD